MASPAAVTAAPLLPRPSSSASAAVGDGRMGKGWEDMEVRVAALDGGLRERLRLRGFVCVRVCEGGHAAQACVCLSLTRNAL